MIINIGIRLKIYGKLKQFKHSVNRKSLPNNQLKSIRPVAFHTKTNQKVIYFFKKNYHLIPSKPAFKSYSVNSPRKIFDFLSFFLFFSDRIILKDLNNIEDRNKTQAVFLTR